MAYNLTNITNAETSIDLIKATNIASNGILVISFVVAIWIIVLISIRIDDIFSRIAIASFVTFLPSLLFSYMGILHPVFPIVFLVATGLSALALKIT